MGSDWIRLDQMTLRLMVNVCCQVFKEEVQNQIVFDRDAHWSGPTIHFVVDKTLVQNLL